MTTIKGITIRQPWAVWICHRGKHIENRVWPPPQSMVGGHLAILSALSNGALAREEIIARTGISKHAVATALSRLKRRGDVESVGHGYWKRSQ